jgi:hypothetical protein
MTRDVLVGVVLEVGVSGKKSCLEGREKLPRSYIISPADPHSGSCGEDPKAHHTDGAYPCPISAGGSDLSEVAWDQPQACLGAKWTALTWHGLVGCARTLQSPESNQLPGTSNLEEISSRAPVGCSLHQEASCA